MSNQKQTANKEAVDAAKRKVINFMLSILGDDIGGTVNLTGIVLHEFLEIDKEVCKKAIASLKKEGNFSTFTVYGVEKETYANLGDDIGEILTRPNSY